MNDVRRLEYQGSVQRWSWVLTRSARAGTVSGQVPGHEHRFWEVDVLRGVAIVMMVLYHFMYDLYFFQVTNTIFTNRLWFYFQRTTATTFILLVGVSLAISRTRASTRRERLPYSRLAGRSLRIFGWGMVISLITFFILGPELYIRFGVLHFIAMSIALAYPFLGYRWANLLLGTVLVGTGKVLQQFTFQWPWLVWLGFEPADHVYVDYFPLIPWFGVLLVGIFLGNSLYRGDRRTFILPDWSSFLLVRFLQRLGQHSLAAYLLHQPLLFALLILTFLLLGIDRLPF
jgi:uncharacterized membrane protein